MNLRELAYVLCQHAGATLLSHEGPYTDTIFGTTWLKALLKLPSGKEGTGKITVRFPSDLWQDIWAELTVDGDTLYVKVDLAPEGGPAIIRNIPEATRSSSKETDSFAVGLPAPEPSEPELPEFLRTDEPAMAICLSESLPPAKLDPAPQQSPPIEVEDVFTYPYSD